MSIEIKPPTSFSTFICWVRPALLVTVGFGAAFIGLVGAVPQLNWISQHKVVFFGFGAIMLTVAGVLQWIARKTACPIETELVEACGTTRDWSPLLHFVSIGLYAIGAGFVFVIPLLQSE